MYQFLDSLQANCLQSYLKAKNVFTQRKTDAHTFVSTSAYNNKAAFTEYFYITESQCRELIAEALLTSAQFVNDDKGVVSYVLNNVIDLFHLQNPKHL